MGRTEKLRILSRPPESRLRTAHGGCGAPGEYLCDNLLLRLPHRQVVWAIPRVLHRFLRHHGELFVYDVGTRHPRYRFVVPIPITKTEDNKHVL
jgi:hypothetical protein